jgi:hypothetical protein
MVARCLWALSLARLMRFRCSSDIILYHPLNSVLVKRMSEDLLTYATFSIPIPCKPLHSIVISDQSRWILKFIRRLSLSSSLVTLDSTMVSSCV